MGKWIAIAVIAGAVAIGLGAYFGDGDGPPWRDHDSQVVTTADGQTTVIEDDYDGPHFPFFIIPLVIIGFVLFSIGRRRGGGPWGEGPWGGGPGTREDAWREWHRREHESAATGSDAVQS